MAVLQSSVRHHARGRSPHSVGTKDSRRDCASIVLQVYAIRRFAEGVVQATAHLENKMETSVGIQRMVVASTCHEGVVLGKKRTDCRRLKLLNMNKYITYGIIFIILLLLELAYFKIADKFNIIDKPNERSSHSTIVLRGGGIIFLLGAWVWSFAFGFQYPWFLLGLTLVAGVSFIDDIHSLPDSVRLVVQFTAAALAFYQLGMLSGEWFETNGMLVGCLLILLALIVYVGATNVINFMDGINGITAGYSFAVLLPLLLMNAREGFMSESFLAVSLLSVLVFTFFNFRPRGKAKCFAGDVGSVGIAFILLFAIGMLIVRTGDITWLIFLLVYGVDGCLTICHRILLHENLGEAHRKHAYQLMANELKMSHPLVSCIYMFMQLVVSLGFIYLCPVLASASGLSLVAWHWIYLALAFVLLAVAYVLFKKKYYHLHEEYLASLKK